MFKKLQSIIRAVNRRYKFTRSVRVDKGGNGNFTTWKDACDWVAANTTRDASNFWLIEGNLGGFSEENFTVPTFTTLKGSGGNNANQNTTIFRLAVAGDTNFITMEEGSQLIDLRVFLIPPVAFSAAYDFIIAGDFADIDNCRVDNIGNYVGANRITLLRGTGTVTQILKIGNGSAICGNGSSVDQVASSSQIHADDCSLYGDHVDSISVEADAAIGMLTNCIMRDPTILPTTELKLGVGAVMGLYNTRVENKTLGAGASTIELHPTPEQLGFGRRATKALQTSGIWAGSGQPIRDASTGVPIAWLDSESFDDGMHNTSIADSGTATGVHAGTTLQDTTQSWTVNQFAGYGVRITGGTNIDDVARIVSNTADTITIDVAWQTTVDNTSTYEFSLTTRVEIVTDGTYLVTPRITFSGNAVGLRGIFLYLDGSFFNSIFALPVATVESAVALPPETMTLMAGQFLEMRAYQTSGGVLDFLAFGNRVQLGVTKISQ